MATGWKWPAFKSEEGVLNFLHVSQEEHGFVSVVTFSTPERDDGETKCLAK